MIKLRDYVFDEVCAYTILKEGEEGYDDLEYQNELTDRIVVVVKQFLKEHID